MENLIKQFEKESGLSAMIESELYADGEIYAKEYTEWLEKRIQALSMSGVVSGAKQLCPKCSGQGIVSKPPHIAGDQNEWTGIGLSHKCNLCDGKMVI